jgi:NodT family efflux transporter outer membrane factor (OMF) lipoprotein
MLVAFPSLPPCFRRGNGMCPDYHQPLQEAVMNTGVSGNGWVGWRRAVVYLILPGWFPLLLCGCTSFSDWAQNGFKVGPNYHASEPAVAPHWIDADDPRVRPGNPNIASWWEVFDDPELNRMIHVAATENLTARQAGLQIMQAQIQRNIARSELLPQAQSLLAQGTHGEFSNNNGFTPVPGPSSGTGLAPSAIVGPLATATAPIAGMAAPLSLAGTTTTATSPLISGVAGASSAVGIPTGGSRFFNDLGTSMNLDWELDFWGLFRRNLEAANASLDQSMQNYNEIMVQLLANVATQYIEIRTLQKRLELARQNVRLQEPLVAKLEQQYKAGLASSKPAYFQLKSNLDNTRALIPPLEIGLRQANNQLCVLLGVPVHDLVPQMGNGYVADPRNPAERTVHIPRSKDDTLVLGIPGDLLLRRPDVQAMERQLRIQSAQIGIAEAEMYPHIGINGSVGVAADRLGLLFNQQSWVGSVGPSLTWNILNYGRLLANVRSQNTQYQQFVLAYQQAVLNANQDAENALVAYLQSLEQSKRLEESANDAIEVTRYYYIQLAGGYLPPAASSLSFYNQIFTAVNFQVQQQDAAAQAEGNVALNLILLYRALGGGWQIGLKDASSQGTQDVKSADPPQAPPTARIVPAPGQVATSASGSTLR